jgi:four helix bundle protein
VKGVRLKANGERAILAFKSIIMRDYKKLDVWKKPHKTYLFIKKDIVSNFPKEERFELTAQLNRATLSIPLNILEGSGRFTDKDFAHFLDTALGSTNEVDYYCFAALELNYITDEKYQLVNNLINEVRAMLISFLKFLRKE